MSSLRDQHPLINPPALVRHRTIIALIDVIAEALNNDGATVDPASLDSTGLVIEVDGMRLRLGITEEVPAYEETEEDVAAWYRINAQRFERFMAERKADAGHDANGAFAGHLDDPCGVNGQEHPDDVTF